MIEDRKRIVERDGKTFVAVCASSDVLRARGKRAVLDELTEVALFRVAGTCYALSNICPHQHQPIIAEGIVDRGCVICPMHGWQFRLDDGQEVDNLGRIKTFESFEQEGYVYVEYTPNSRPAWMNSDI